MLKRSLFSNRGIKVDTGTFIKFCYFVSGIPRFFKESTTTPCFPK